MSEKQTTPEVLWAQRSSTIDPERNYITLTISAPDVPSPKIDLQPTSLTFSGYSETKKTTYHVELELYAEIDPKESKTHATSHSVTFQLRKKEMKEEFWPRLLKEDKKVHFLKTDFDKWVDEDEQDGAADEEMPGGMGGMPDMGGMGGMGDMGGMGGAGGFDGLDFSKLGGAGGMGGDPNIGGLGEDDADADADDADDDDDDMPALEDDDGDDKAGGGDDDVGGKAKAAEKAGEEEAGDQDAALKEGAKGKGKAKIEEVE